MAFKKTGRKPARAAAKPMDKKDGACPCGCGASDGNCGACCCGRSRAKRIIVKAIVLVAVVFLSAHLAKCMIMHEFKRRGPHMMEMHKGCDGEKKGGWFKYRERGHKGEAPAKPAEAK